MRYGIINKYAFILSRSFENIGKFLNTLHDIVHYPLIKFSYLKSSKVLLGTVLRTHQNHFSMW